MGLVDAKKDVFTTIGAYTSLSDDMGRMDKIRKLAGSASEISAIGSAYDTTNIFSSINNKKEVVPFLLDVLKVVVGTTGLEQLTGELLTNFISELEPKLKDSVKKQLIKFNAGAELPDFDISMDVKNIDIYSKLKVNPGSSSGDLLYNKLSPNFDLNSYTAIVADGTDVVYNNLLVNYNSTLDAFSYKPNITNPNTTIGEWLSDYIDNTTFLDPKEFSTKILNEIYGTITAVLNKTPETIFNELAVDKIINQVIGDDQSFELKSSDLNDLMIKAQEMSEGIVTYDMGCGLLKSELSMSGMTNLIATISGSTDPFVVGNAINETLGSSFTADEETSEKNKETIRDGFFARLIEILTNELAKTLTTSPQARMLLSISSSFENNGIPQISDPRDDLKKFKVFINCAIKDAMAALNEFIYGLIIGFLIILLDPIIRGILKEKINQYLGVIKSLISSKI